MPKFPARVHPILARKANIAVIIRRSPSKSVCTMLRNRSKGLGDVKVLHDFNDMAFEAIAASY